jgi:ABC-2 type transport system ATP-binding protein
MAVIDIRGLTKRFGRRLAVDHVSFSVERGEIVGFLGPNGAGKTTTLRMLLGLVIPSEGSATLNGRRYTELDHPARTVGALLDAAGAYPGRSARDHLRVQALAGGTPARRIDEVLSLVDLDEAADQRVGTFSLGMRQRLGLATALLHEPEVLILDEPANGLDPEGVRWLRALLRDLAGEGRTVLVSSHILAEVAQIVDSVVILDRGRLVAHAPLAELTGAGGVIRIRTPQAARLHAELTARGMRAGMPAPDRVEVADGSSEEIGIIAARLGVPIFETTTEVADLEDVFLRLTGATTEGVSS